MLDGSLKDQLKEHFSKLEKDISLLYDESVHENQNELIEMLTDVAETSSKIKAVSSGEKSLVPRFKILSNGEPTGISVKGIPGGHEFTSLVIAILNADGKGKLPDRVLSERIKRIKGPIKVMTFISLSCENCPAVVQALNQMALIHPDFEHEFIDGGYAQDQVQSLGIQGVPSVIVDSKLLHSGKSQLLELVEKLEKAYGTSTKELIENLNLDLGHFDVVVVGGGPAGASAAIYSVRKGLKTALLAERIGGQVQDTKGIENLISIIYTEGPKLSAQLYEHMSAYPIVLFEQRRVADVKVEDNNKIIILSSGEKLSTESLIITTGAKWRELGVPGEKEYIGQGVAYCPHCDGPFYKGKKVAVVGGGNSGVEAAIDLAGIVGEVVLFEFQETLKADQVLVDKLKSLANVSIVTNAKTKEIHGNGKKVNALKYENRVTGEDLKVELDGIFVQIGLLPNSSFVKGVVNLTKFGEIIVDEKGRTSVPGIYAAGDVTTTPYKQIIIAMGEGAKAALASFEDRMYKQPLTGS
jgi:alkyl hydroperoxide reductase subunit F